MDILEYLRSKHQEVSGKAVICARLEGDVTSEVPMKSVHAGNAGR